MGKGMEMEKHKLCSRDSRCGEEASPLLRDTCPDCCGLPTTWQHSPVGTPLGTDRGWLVLITSCISSNRPQQAGCHVAGRQPYSTANTKCHRT